MKFLTKTFELRCATFLLPYTFSLNTRIYNLTTIVYMFFEIKCDVKTKKYIATQFVNKTYLFCFIVRLFRCSLNTIVFIYSFDTRNAAKTSRLKRFSSFFHGISSSKIVLVICRRTGKLDEKHANSSSTHWFILNINIPTLYI